MGVGSNAVDNCIEIDDSMYNDKHDEHLHNHDGCSSLDKGMMREVRGVRNHKERGKCHVQIIWTATYYLRVFVYENKSIGHVVIAQMDQ